MSFLHLKKFNPRAGSATLDTLLVSDHKPDIFARVVKKPSAGNERINQLLCVASQDGILIPIPLTRFPNQPRQPHPDLKTDRLQVPESCGADYLFKSFAGLGRSPMRVPLPVVGIGQLDR